MAKLRQNHQKQGSKVKGMMIRMVVFLGFIAFGLYYLMNSFGLLDMQETEPFTSEIIEVSSEIGQPFYLPVGGKGELIHHNSYSISYDEKYEQAEWVAYELTKQQLLLPNLPRKRWFDVDPMVSTKSAKHNDYSHSGYTRGHLIASADRSYDKELMAETFLMSNMSPQLEKFNGGVWNELENQVRKWAFKNDRLLVITGPVLDTSIKKYIGKSSKIGVPNQFYKVLLDIDGDERKGIGFILPHEKSDKSLASFMVSIDEVEALTGLDFFGELLSPKLESELEANYQPNLWPLDQVLFKRRVNEWNH